MGRNADQAFKEFHSYNAAEFLWMRKRLGRIRTTLIKTSAQTPESKNVAEGMNRTLMEKIGTTLNKPATLHGL